MTEVPKIVAERLRAAGQAVQGTHPEANVLTAFAEQALPQAERQGVLEHLAACAECREVVALALPLAEPAPAVEPSAEPVASPNRARTGPRWFGFSWANLSWANLRWAALAAGIAVAVLIVRPGLQRGKPSVGVVSSVSKQSNVPAPVPANSASTPELAKAAPEDRNIVAKAQVAAPRRELADNKQRFLAQPATPAAAGAIAADNLKKDSGRLDQFQGASSRGVASNAPQRMNETVEVSGAAADVATAPSAGTNLIAREETPPVIKSKPARDEASDKDLGTAYSTARAKAAPAVSGMVAGNPLLTSSLRPVAKWTVSAGVLQRSLDGGQSWQTVVKADHALLCYALSGQEVWAGGQAGTLLHSSDGGASWTRLQVATQAQPLAADVIQVEAREAGYVVLTAANGEVWSSHDRGATWKRK